MYFVMERYYAQDIDELITYRSNEFVKTYSDEFTVNDIALWNRYNEDMQILAYDNNATYTMDKPVQKPFFNNAEGHEVDYRILYRKIEIENTAFILASRVPMIERKDLLRTLSGQYGLLFIILLVSLTIIQSIVSKKLWKPFYNTLDKVTQFNLEKSEIPEFCATNTKEFQNLNEILTDLLLNDVKVYNNQKKFIENASHELQTPLAIFQSQLDILLQEEKMPEKQADIIQSLYAVVIRMTRLNKNLLLLAKLDNIQFKDRENIDFNDVLHTQLLYLKNLAENNGLKVYVNIKNELKINANKTLLESLINNLMVNAITHNTENGIIEIIVEDNSFVVKNTGKQQPLDESRIFQRFSRISEEKRGNGLGLSIVYQISKFHKWTIEYSYEDNYHSFKILF